MSFMKNIVLSVFLVVITLVLGYYLFSHDSLKKGDVNLGVNLDYFATSTNTNTANTTQTPPATTTTTPKPVVTVATTSATTTPNQNKKSHMITIDTNYGQIVFETYDADAPNTVSNFVTLANKGFYNGLIFHRVIKGFMIQGGDPSGNGTGGPGYKFADELNPNTASYKAGYKKGVVAMANSGPNTNGSQFFIMTADYPLPNAYTIFGKVVSGQDVVDKIANVPTGSNDKPVSPVTMKTVTVK